MNPKYYWYVSSIILLIVLIFFALLWEGIIAPVRPGGSWLILKVLPLCGVFSGCLKQKRRSYQIAALMLPFYLAEGVVRLTDPTFISRVMAALEIMISLGLFIAILQFLRHERAIKLRQP